MRIALAQVITGRDLAGNLDLVADYAARAKSGGAELVVFPEATMRSFGNSLLDIAEPLDGPWASSGARHRGGAGHRDRCGDVHPREIGQRRERSATPCWSPARVSRAQLRQGASVRRLRVPANRKQIEAGAQN